LPWPLELVWAGSDVDVDVEGFDVVLVVVVVTVVVVIVVVVVVVIVVVELTIAELVVELGLVVVVVEGLVLEVLAGEAETGMVVEPETSLKAAIKVEVENTTAVTGGSDLPEFANPVLGTEFTAKAGSDGDLRFRVIRPKTTSSARTTAATNDLRTVPLVAKLCSLSPAPMQPELAVAYLKEHNATVGLFMANA
jgi:hypothetical protein